MLGERHGGRSDPRLPHPRLRQYQRHLLRSDSSGMFRRRGGKRRKPAKNARHNSCIGKPWSSPNVELPAALPCWSSGVRSVMTPGKTIACGFLCSEIWNPRMLHSQHHGHSLPIAPRFQVFASKIPAWIARPNWTSAWSWSIRRLDPDSSGKKARATRRPRGFCAFFCYQLARFRWVCLQRLGNMGLLIAHYRREVVKSEASTSEFPQNAEAQQRGTTSNQSWSIGASIGIPRAYTRA